MARQVKKKLHRVVLYVEVPAAISDPKEWDWNGIVNHDAREAKHECPVIGAHSEPWKLAQT